MSPGLILERHHRLIAAAESGNSQQSALRLGHDDHRSVAIYGVPGGGKVPLPSLWLHRLLADSRRRLSGWRQPGDRKRQK
jgi:hypothetical protein